MAEENKLTAFVPINEENEIESPEEIKEAEENLDVTFKETAKLKIMDFLESAKSQVTKKAIAELTTETVEKYMSEVELIGQAYFKKKALIHKTKLFNIALFHATQGKEWAFMWLASQIDGSKAPIRKTKATATYQDLLK